MSNQLHPGHKNFCRVQFMGIWTPADCDCGATRTPPQFWSVWQFQCAAQDFVCVGIFHDAPAARACADEHRHEGTHLGHPVPRESRTPGAIIVHQDFRSLAWQIQQSPKVEQQLGKVVS